MREGRKRISRSGLDEMMRRGGSLCKKPVALFFFFTRPDVNYNIPLMSFPNKFYPIATPKRLNNSP